MTAVPHRLYLVALAAAWTCVSCNGQVRDVGRFGPYRVVTSIDLENGMTSLTEWDANTVAVVSPGKGTAEIYQVVDGRHLRTVRLTAPDQRRVPPLYPDIYKRIDDVHVVRLARSAGRIEVISLRDASSQTLRINCSRIAWMDVSQSGRIDAFCAGVSEPEVRYVRMGIDGGSMVNERTSWVAPRKADNGVTDTLFLSDYGVEMLAQFPYGRISNGTTAPIDLGHVCSAAESLIGSFERDRVQDGLPPPLGASYKREKSRRPFALWLTRSRNAALALINGNYLARFDATTGRDQQCWQLPFRGSPSTAPIAVSVASSDSGIAWLSRAGKNDGDGPSGSLTFAVAER